LEAKIAYRFKNTELIDLALTHRSFKNEDSSLDENYSNERLEYLGDAVLQLIVAEELFRRFPDSNEGEMTEMRRILVNGKFLAQKAREFDLGSELRMSAGEEETGGRRKSSLLADSYEAMVGAIFIDGGITAARKFLKKKHLVSMQEHLASVSHINFKGTLLEELQARGKHPEYRTIKATGPDHKRNFEVAVYLDSEEIGRGSGLSKKSAEKAAAKDAMTAFKITRAK
ncbi:ribonuclease III, partial [bacterium]|nr:ribonuclease III [bacterium]